MPDSTRWNKLYERRKANGECPRCGNKIDRNGFYCNYCLEKHRTYVNQTRAFLREIGICPQCQKNSLIGKQRICLECLAKQSEYRAKNKKPLTKDRKIQISERGKARYNERIAKGLCTRCGKIKADYGKKKCKGCLEKDATLHRLRRGNLVSEADRQ